MLNNLEVRIMKDLKFGHTHKFFFAGRYDVSEDEFYSAIRRLGIMGYVYYDERDKEPFKGHLYNIRISLKGIQEFDE
ncbi:hypothetical protein EAI30_03540 [Romboutsia ilealis]|uniref:Uncharacterized protein n=1 Tax=Romboutsia faecis TaxID=2764597 RepID=A0ABR7JKM4_9FIRM|nr:hypothetical protein [Romboutsia faecis]MBC5995484.1 hypothetical protein [Romboutsia faecis]MRN23685.1 hypothetical protein [Romboutsia ilealis]